MATRAPSAASRRAVAAPMPLPPPVTSAVRPSRRMARQPILRRRDARPASRSSAAPAPSASAWRCAGRAPASRRDRLARRRPRGRGGRARARGRSRAPTSQGWRTPRPPQRARRRPVGAVPAASRRPTTNPRASSRDQLLVDATVPLAAACRRQAPRGCSASGRAPPRQQARRWSRTACASSARCTRSAPPSLTDLEHALDEDVLVCGDRRDAKQRGAALIARIDGPAPRRRGPARAGAHHRGAHAAADRLNIRYKTHAGISITGLPDGAGSRPRRRHRRREARPRDARRGRRRAGRDRQHRRRRRDLRRRTSPPTRTS